MAQVFEEGSHHPLSSLRTGKGDICWQIVFLCFSPGLIGYFVLLSLRNVLLLCNRSEHVSRRA